MNAGRFRCTGSIRFIWGWMQNEHLIDNGSSARDVPEIFLIAYGIFATKRFLFVGERRQSAFCDCASC
jgi:hypothetical protein